MRNRRHGVVVLALLAALGAGCSSGDDVEAAGRDGGPTTSTASAPRDATTTSLGATSTTVDPTAVAPSPSAGCEVDTPVAAGSADDVTISSAGLERVYRRYVPKSYDPGTATPVILEWHGLTQPYKTLPGVTGLEAAAEEHGFVVVTPAGRENPKPYLDAGLHEGNEDLTFTTDLLDDLEADLCVDTRRIYSTGISNGGLMSSLLACTHASRIAAVAPVSGLQFPNPCDADRHVPIVEFHGTADNVLLFDGGLGPGLTGAEDTGVDTTPATPTSDGATPGSEPADPDGKGMDDLMAAWARHHNCAVQSVREEVSDEVLVDRYSGCDDGADVVHYRVLGGGHTWHGSPVMANLPDDIKAVVGYTTTDISATDLMIEFFAQHPIPG